MATQTPPTQTRFPEITASGPPRELGRQIGEATRDLIPPLLDHILYRLNQRRAAPITRDQALAAASRFIPVVQAYSPDMLEELHGIAEGANVAPEKVMLINARGEIAALISSDATSGSGCTTVAVEKHRAAGGNAFVGQNWDNDLGMRPYSVVLTRRPEGKPAFMTWGQAGLIAYIGLSETGFGIAMNAIAGPGNPGGLPWYFTVRGVYESRNLDEAVAAVNRSDRARAGNLGMITPQGAVDFEVQVDGFGIVHADPDGLFVHTNHCNHPGLAHNNEQFADSLYGQTYDRETRAHDILSAKAGPISIDDAKAILSDHAGHPTSICRHPNDHPSSGEDRSVVSIILEPEPTRMHLTNGNPCESPYEVYTLN